MEFLTAFVEPVWMWFTEKVVPWLSEKFRPTFSISQFPGLPSFVSSSFANEITHINISTFLSVTNHSDQKLYFTGASLRALKWGNVEHVTFSEKNTPAHENCRILLNIHLQRTDHYVLQEGEANATLCIEGNSHIKKRVRVRLKNVASQK
jgi:hypothetical protein